MLFHYPSFLMPKTKSSSNHEKVNLGLTVSEFCFFQRNPKFSFFCQFFHFPHFDTKLKENKTQWYQEFYLVLTPEAIFLVVCDPSMNEL
jgi:hypothetical protein